MLDRLQKRADLHIQLQDFGIDNSHPGTYSVELDELVVSILALAASSDAPRPASPPDESTE